MAGTGDFEESLNPQEEREPDHPGWLPLGKVLETSDPFFERFLFMLGFDMSSNVYLMIGDHLAIVDPGNDYTAYLDLFRRGFTPAQIKKIVLTHGHSDHSMGVFELLRSYPSIAHDGGFELVLHEAGPSEIKKAATIFGCKVTEVRGGETIELGGAKWEVIHTPGHTVDGICLYHSPTRTLITGDTVQPHAMAEPDEDAGGRLDYYLYSIKDLLKRDIENVLPGHGAPKGAVGRLIVEETYVSLMMKIIGAEKPIPWVHGATALTQRGLLEEALYCCEKALALDPEDSGALQMKALCLNDLGRFDEAMGVFEKLEGNSHQTGSNPFIPVGKGYALMGLGKYVDSIKFFDQALKIRPDLRDASVYKGMALYLAGSYDEAMEIEPFRVEFAGKFKEELQKREQPPN